MNCRRRHADVLEWAWFVNSYGDDGVYSQLMNGDKDSFLLAFALANKTGDYYQVSCPPSRKPKMQLHAQSIQAKKKETKPRNCQYSLGLSLTYMSHASAQWQQYLNRGYSSNIPSSQVVLLLDTCVDGTDAFADEHFEFCTLFPAAGARVGQAMLTQCATGQTLLLSLITMFASGCRVYLGRVRVCSVSSSMCHSNCTYHFVSCTP